MTVSAVDTKNSNSPMVVAVEEAAEMHSVAAVAAVPREQNFAALGVEEAEKTLFGRLLFRIFSEAGKINGEPNLSVIQQNVLCSALAE